MQTEQAGEILHFVSLSLFFFFFPKRECIHPCTSQCVIQHCNADKKMREKQKLTVSPITTATLHFGWWLSGEVGWIYQLNTVQRWVSFPAIIIQTKNNESNNNNKKQVQVSSKTIMQAINHGVGFFLTCKDLGECSTIYSSPAFFFFQ